MRFQFGEHRLGRATAPKVWVHVHAPDLGYDRIERPVGTHAHDDSVSARDEVNTPWRGWIVGWPDIAQCLQLWVQSPGFNGGQTEQIQGIRRLRVSFCDDQQLDQAKTSNPYFFTTASNLSAIPLGCLLPDSHFWMVDSLVLRYRAKTG